MQPGSLIFLVIVAVWAVYLVQHWIRRRDHLATARSVDRFSDAMRVLERRAAPAVDGYATAAPPRPALVARSAGARPGSPRPVTSGREAGPQRPAPRPSPARPGTTARRVRGVVVLATLLALPLTLLLSAVGAVAWSSVLVALGALAVVVAWTRASVRREQAVHRAARVAERRRVRPPRGVAPSSVAGPPMSYESPAAQQQPAAAHRPVADQPGHPVTAETVSAAEQGVPVAQPAVYDLMAVDESDRAAVAAAAFAQQWSPVPVPTPTYMLKDSAPRPSTSWDDAAVGGSVPVPIEVEDDELDQLMAARNRRVVG